MKGWTMIHPIKALYKQGHGSTQREIAAELGISRNTVSKYLKMADDEIGPHLQSRRRGSRLDAHREYMIHLLRQHPKLSAVKMERFLRTAGLETGVSLRTLRDYLRKLKQGVAVKQRRYFEPVLDMVAGVQCQVDGGQLHQVLINQVLRSVYFLVFVLSYSRWMTVVLSPRPFTTESWVQAHDVAFRRLGGMCQECVYDQTRLVVIEEKYREVWLNERFSQYATTVGFQVRVCEGYDPQSKGKVEAGVKYVKNNFFYGESFVDWDHLEQALLQWLETVANPRIHGTTHQVPQVVLETQERQHLRPYVSPSQLVSVPRGESRQVDKTGLFSYQSNKYSVPLKYQRAQVWVIEEGSELIVQDALSQEEIARHPLCLAKGQILKNPTHYRDPLQQVQDLEQRIVQRIGKDLMQPLAVVLKATLPTYYKDQLIGLERVLKQYDTQDAKVRQCLAHLAQCSQLRVSFLKSYLEVHATSTPSVPESPELKRSPLLQKYGTLPQANPTSTGGGL